VAVCERYGILRVDEDQRASKCLCIADADEPWIECDSEPLTWFTPEVLSQRMQNLRGFLVPVDEVLKGREFKGG
jgi:hypothetical protein